MPDDFPGLPQAIRCTPHADAYLTEHAIDALISSNRVDWAKALIAAGQLKQKSIAESWSRVPTRGSPGYAQPEAMRLMADLHGAWRLKRRTGGPATTLALAARGNTIETLQRPIP